MFLLQICCYVVYEFGIINWCHINSQREAVVNKNFIFAIAYCHLSLCVHWYLIVCVCQIYFCKECVFGYVWYDL